MTDERCGTCRAWAGDEHPFLGPQDCRRRAPVLPPENERWKTTARIWPQTANDDWCREWEPKPDAEQPRDRAAERGPPGVRDAVQIFRAGQEL